MHVMLTALVACLFYPGFWLIPTQRLVPPILLPTDPNSVVLTLDYPGGGPMLPVSPGPHLVVYADGRVTVNDPQGEAKKVNGMIRREELQALLQYAIDDCKILDVNDGKIREVIQAKQQAKELFLTYDRSYPSITIRTLRHSNKADLYPVSPPLGKPFPSDPNLSLLHGLNRLVDRLRLIMARVWLGGEAELEAAIRLANDHLSRQIPEAPALTSGDLILARELVDGRTEIQFARSILKLKQRVEVRIEKRQEGVPSVTVRTYPGSE